MFLFIKSLFLSASLLPRGRWGSLATHWSHYTVREKSGQKHLAFHDQSTYKWWSMIKTTSWLSWPCSSGFTSTRYKLNFYVKCLCINTQQNIYGYLYLPSMLPVFMFAMKRCQKLHVCIAHPKYIDDQTKGNLRISVTPPVQLTCCLPHLVGWFNCYQNKCFRFERTQGRDSTNWVGGFIFMGL